MRRVVYALRNAGINTLSSCGHDMWIQCDTCDPTEELATIYTVLRSLGYDDFRLEVCWDVTPNAADSHILTIQLRRA